MSAPQDTTKAVITHDQARELLRHLPEVVWDATVWLPGCNYVAGTVDVADRVRIVAAVLRAQSAGAA